MSIKDIVVHLDTSDNGRVVADFALALAARTGAHLTAAGVAVQYLGPVGLEDSAGYEAFMELAEQSRKAAEAAYQTLKAAAPGGVETDYVEIEALAPAARERFGALARHFDLSVVGQGGPDGGEEDMLMIEGALLDSGRPVFIVPANHAAGVQLDRVMLCWNASVPAARALAGAMPLLKLAKQVEVVDVMSEGQTAQDLPGFNITRHLSRHGVNATLKRLPNARDIGQTLLTYAAESGANYMVMGGYGHWRLREFVLGGATRTVLAGMKIPVLMAH